MIARQYRWHAAAAALVLGSALAAVSPLRDAATLGPADFAELRHSLAYLAGAPLFGIWDVLSLLTVSQHYAVLASVVFVYCIARILALRGRRSATTSPLRRLVGLVRRTAVELLRAAVALIALLVFYAGAALIPRPMARIELRDANLLAVNFHSHTNHSHDAWGLFSASRNRAWHEGAGFDAAYVTDHYTWAGVDDALPQNPARAGERTVLLSGAELRLRNRHVNALGDRERYVFALDSSWHHLDPERLAAARRQGGRAPTMLYALPGPLEQIVPKGPDSVAGVIGVELSDGAPRGLEQVLQFRREIVALADSFDLAVVAGANIHGWGRTAAAWTVMEIPGWQRLSPSALGDAIEATLHRERRQAAVVAERRLPYHDGSTVRLVATLPHLVWEHSRMLSSGERLSWLLWIAASAALARRRQALRQQAGQR